MDHRTGTRGRTRAGRPVEQPGRAPRRPGALRRRMSWSTDELLGPFDAGPGRAVPPAARLVSVEDGLPIVPACDAVPHEQRGPHRYVSDQRSP